MTYARVGYLTGAGQLKASPMCAVSVPRLYLLRAVYLMIAGGLFAVVWPRLIQDSQSWGLMEGIVQCMLAAFSLLLLLGLRYPLQMLPLLLWELGWKCIWLGVVAYPLWSAGRLDKETASLAGACLIVVVVPPAIPWRYVYERYLKNPGDRWR